MSNNTGTTRLNTLLQERGEQTSLSWVTSWTGPPNAKIWNAVCKINGQPRGEASASRLNVAKDRAADIAWDYLVQNS